MVTFTEEQRKKINNQALALKYGVSTKYIQLLLKGEREQNTDVAKAIIIDVQAILSILENPAADK